MTTHAFALKPGGEGWHVEKFYLLRYFYFSLHWVGYRNLKHEMIVTGFIILAILHHVDRTIGWVRLESVHLAKTAKKELLKVKNNGITLYRLIVKMLHR